MADAQGVPKEESLATSQASDGTKSLNTLSLSAAPDSESQTQADDGNSSTTESEPPATPAKEDDDGIATGTTLFVFLLCTSLAGNEGAGAVPETTKLASGVVGPWDQTSRSSPMLAETTVLGTVRGHSLRCPMCAEEFYHRYSVTGADFKADQGGPDAQRVVDAGWLRCTLFGTAYARDFCVKRKKPLIIMESEEARKLVLLNREKYMFNKCEELPQTALEGTRWFSRVVAADIAQSFGATPAPDSGLPAPVAPVIYPRPVEGEAEKPKNTFNMAWMILDHGNNQYRMSPILCLDACCLIVQTEGLGGVTKTMTAEEFNAMTKARGGLKTVVESFGPDDVTDALEMDASSRLWLAKMLGKPPRDPDYPSDDEWYKRIALAFGFSTRPPLECGGSDNDDGTPPPAAAAADADDEQNDSDESLPELPIV
ncbi:hypothetical protein AYO21_08108 [Fonsecaea monophora]|uniref:Uncharacterized protein n=1 Tax=Fonsecaea monophora TaxID=254056 RepID=A0A177EZY5_9EURO|nr:hypothetical protein AYO21_08108 [Fonsecaea monophora]OAG37624.1 hypothetical protein AYO21_08108 [Fonsecaea monophora]